MQWVDQQSARHACPARDHELVERPSRHFSLRIGVRPVAQRAGAGPPHPRQRRAQQIRRAGLAVEEPRAHSDAALAGALDVPSSPGIGSDACAFLGYASGVAITADLKVGLSVSLSGPNSSLGIPYVKGMQAALAYKGEIAGRKVQLIVSGGIRNGADVAKLEKLYAVRYYPTKVLPGVTVARITTRATSPSFAPAPT